MKGYLTKNCEIDKANEQENRRRTWCTLRIFEVKFNKVKTQLLAKEE